MFHSLIFTKPYKEFHFESLEDIQRKMKKLRLDYGKAISSNVNLHDTDFSNLLPSLLVITN